MEAVGRSGHARRRAAGRGAARDDARKPDTRYAPAPTAVDAAPAHAHLRLSMTTSRAGGSAKDELRALRGAARALGHALVRRIHLVT